MKGHVQLSIIVEFRLIRLGGNSKLLLMKSHKNGCFPTQSRHNVFSITVSLSSERQALVMQISEGITIKLDLGLIDGREISKQCTLLTRIYLGRRHRRIANTLIWKPFYDSISFL